MLRIQYFCTFRIQNAPLFVSSGQVGGGVVTLAYYPFFQSDRYVKLRLSVSFQKTFFSGKGQNHTTTNQKIGKSICRTTCVQTKNHQHNHILNFEMKFIVADEFLKNAQQQGFILLLMRYFFTTDNFLLDFNMTFQFFVLSLSRRHTLISYYNDKTCFKSSHGVLLYQIISVMKSDRLLFYITFLYYNIWIC